MQQNRPANLTEAEIQDYLLGQTRQMFIRQLLLGDSISEAELALFRKRFEIELASNRFVVIHFVIGHMESAIAPKNSPLHVSFMIDNVLSTLLEDAGRAFSVIDTDVTIHLVNLFDTITYDRLHSAVRTVVSVFQENLGIQIQAAISREYDDFSKISIAFAETEEILEFFHFSESSEQVFTYTMFLDRRVSFKNDTWLTQEKHLISLVQQKKYGQASDYVNRIFDTDLMDSIFDPKLIKVRVFTAAHSVIQVLSEQNPVHTKTLTDQFFHCMLHANSISDYLSLITDSLSLCASSQNSVGSTPPDWIAQANTYIQNHFDSFEISNKQVAEHVGLSPKYVSEMFRKYNSMSIWDYIHLQRIQKAKALILEGIPIADAAIKVGYGSLITMYRAFKKYAGQLPGELTRKSTENIMK